MDGLWETPIQESNSSAHETSELCGHLKTCGECFCRPVSTCHPGSDTTLLPCAHEYSTPLNTGNWDEEWRRGVWAIFMHLNLNCCVVAFYVHINSAWQQTAGVQYGAHAKPRSCQRSPLQTAAFCSPSIMCSPPWPRVQVMDHLSYFICNECHLTIIQTFVCTWFVVNLCRVLNVLPSSVICALTLWWGVQLLQSCTAPVHGLALCCIIHTRMVWTRVWIIFTCIHDVFLEHS